MIEIPKTYVASIYGVKVYADPRLPIAEWFIGTKQERFELSKLILNLQRFCDCHLIKLDDIGFRDRRDKQNG